MFICNVDMNLASSFINICFKSLDMQASKDNAFGVKLDNGSWTGMRGQLQRKVYFNKYFIIIQPVGNA